MESVIHRRFYTNCFTRKIFTLDFKSSKKLVSNIKNYCSVQNDVFDVVVVGGGIVGMASAREIAFRHPSLKMATVEKEACLAYHQSGRNSGVVHAGIYYKPGSLKAQLCVQGLNLSYRYFDSNNIPYKKCGKLIVATNVGEVETLNELYDRGLKNNVPDLQIVGPDEIKKIEPHCKGLKAIYSPHTGIVDWGSVTKQYGRDFVKAGGRIYFNFQVLGFREAGSTDFKCSEYPVVIQSKNKEIQAKYVLTCAGLHSDKLSDMSECNKDPRIVPFRGEYLVMKADKRYLVNGNIYPVPDPRFPFLGVHFTPRMDGSVWLGPNAVIALKREGYRWSDWNLSESLETVTFSGFQKLALRYLGFGCREVLKSFILSLQVNDLRKFIPELRVEDVERGPSGVRAQAMDAQGNLVEDFVFDSGQSGIGKRILHCRNAPSPGATSSLAIAKFIADKFDVSFNLT